MSTTLGSFIAGGVAACGAVTVTHSFETVKIRLQLQGELQTRKDAPKLYRGVLHGVKVIYQNEGMRGLLRGLNCAVSLQCFPNTGVRMREQDGWQGNDRKTHRKSSATDLRHQAGVPR